LQADQVQGIAIADINTSKRRPLGIAVPDLRTLVDFPGARRVSLLRAPAEGCDHLFIGMIAIEIA
jgi:hypothetical protein